MLLLQLLQFSVFNRFFCLPLIESVRLDTPPELCCRALGTVMSCTAQSLICSWRAERRVTGFNLLSPLFVSLWCITRDVRCQLVITGEQYTPLPWDASPLLIYLLPSSCIPFLRPHSFSCRNSPPPPSPLPRFYYFPTTGDAKRYFPPSPSMETFGSNMSTKAKIYFMQKIWHFETKGDLNLFFCAMGLWPLISSGNNVVIANKPKDVLDFKPNLIH